jgi:hypothetical protein
MGIVDNTVNNKTHNHPCVSREGTNAINATEVEEKLHKTSRHRHRSGANCVTVSVKEAQEMFSLFSSSNLHYEFLSQNFIGNQVFIT